MTPFKELLATPRMGPDTDKSDPNNFLHALLDLLETIRGFQEHLRVLEIGCWHGVSTEFFLQMCAHVTAVDPWSGMDDTFEGFKRRCHDYPNLTIIRGASPQAIEHFSNAFGLCYIDGDHSYESVKGDIIACRYAVAPSGWLAGHDFHLPGVQKAVRELLPEPQIFADQSWLVRNQVLKSLA